VTKKTAHEISHERAEMRHRSRIPAWQQQQQQQQEQEQEPVTSSSDQQTAMPSIIACLGRQQCDRIRRCECIPRGFCVIRLFCEFLLRRFVRSVIRRN